MSNTSKQIGAPEGYASRDPASFSNPGQKAPRNAGKPDRPVNDHPRGAPVVNGPINAVPAGGALGVVHAPTPTVNTGTQNSYAVRVPGGNPKLPDVTGAKE